MRTLRKWLKDYFEPEIFNDLNVGDIGSALNDTSVRTVWLSSLMEELKTINLEVDRRLLSDSQFGLIDLCAKRKAYQDILEGILRARRQVTQGLRPNPKFQGVVDLDKVTT